MEPIPSNTALIPLFPNKNDLSMLSATEWEELYPKNQYKLRSAFALHFLFALGQPLANVEAYITSLKAKNPKALSLPDLQSHYLTPLHIAAMKANTEGAKILLDAFATKKEKLAALNAKDAYGWTPMHHAACTSTSLFELFISEGCHPDTKSANVPTPRELRFYAGKEVAVRSRDHLFALIGNSEALTPVAALSLSERVSLFGEPFTHTDHIIYSQDLLKNLWWGSSNQTEAGHDNFSNKHSAFMANRPSLIIRDCEELSGIVPNSKELAAGQFIPSYSIITEYTGMKKRDIPAKTFIESFTPEYIENTEYSFAGIDARLVGNEAKFSNMGFPNCAVLTRTIDGVERQFLVSLRPIEKGEPILYSYGPSLNFLNLGRQILLGKNEMAEFYRDHPNLLREITEVSKRNIRRKGKSANADNNTAETMRLVAALYFPLECPTALLYLHFNNMTPFNLFDGTVYSNSLFASWMQKFPYEIKMFNCTVNILKKTAELTRRNPSFDLIVKQFVLNKLEKEPLIHILKGLDLLASGEVPGTKEKLLQRLEKVDEALREYDWKKDPDHPFSFQRMVDVSMDYFNKIPREVALLINKEGLNRTPPDTELYAMIAECTMRLSSGVRRPE